MENNELQRYFVQGMIAEELMSETNDSFKVLDESGIETTITAPAMPYRADQRAFRKMIGESLVECFTSPEMAGQKQKADPKIENTRRMIQVVQDMLYRMSDTYYGVEVDQSITKTVQDACNPLIRTMIQKLYDLWVLNKEGGEDKQPEEKPADPVNPAATATVQTLAPVGSESPTLQLAFAQGESIISPQNKEYVIEAVVGEILKVKEKATGAKATVSIDIAKKWKK
jgi:hypothetical protein